MIKVGDCIIFKCTRLHWHSFRFREMEAHKRILQVVGVHKNLGVISLDLQSLNSNDVYIDKICLDSSCYELTTAYKNFSMKLKGDLHETCCRKNKR